MMDISIVIVNYNVKDYLYDCLTSIRQATGHLSIEVIVVDNNSIDGSLAYLEPLFPEVNFIGLPDNLGFGKANNIAIRQAKGKYLLILNPDTIVAEDTLTTMFNYMEAHPNVGIAGCKVLNADGSFQLACRRGFPSPWTSFCKLFGLQAAFPKSKLFARYNMTYLSENETYSVDAVIGAFMFCDTALIQQIGGFDERYFMYGEDIDLCKEVQLRGRDVMYVHHASIIHYKGESTRRSGLDTIKQMYTAMEQFAKKYYSNSALFIAFLRLGINLRTQIAKAGKHIVPIFLILTDILFINLSLMVGSYIKFGQLLGFPDYAYPIVFIAVSVVYWMLQFLNGEYFEHQISLPKTALSLTLSFFILSSFTYFLPDYRFSRSALIVMIGLTLILSFLARLIILLYRRTLGTKADRRVIIAGHEAQIEPMLEAIQQAEPTHIHVIGLVQTDTPIPIDLSPKATTKGSGADGGATPPVPHGIASPVGLPYLGSIGDIAIIAAKNKADEVIITDTNVDKQTIMNIMASSNAHVKYHFITDYDSRGLPYAPLPFAVALNDKLVIWPLRFRFVKRTMDILLSLPLLVLMLPIMPFSSKIKCWEGQWLQVLLGKKTTIGLYDSGNNANEFPCKIGLISLASINDFISISANSTNKLNEYYLKNYSLSLDFDILLRYFTRKQPQFPV